MDPEPTPPAEPTHEVKPAAQQGDPAASAPGGETASSPAPGPDKEAVAERWATRLRESARTHRRWPLATWLLAAAMCGGPLGLLAWWFWPRPAPPLLVITAFDQVRAADQPAVLRAQLEAVGETPARLGG